MCDCESQEDGVLKDCIVLVVKDKRLQERFNT